MDTQEDPGFLSVIGDFAVDGDMMRLVQEVCVVFQSEVSGTECKADAGKLMGLMSKLNDEAQGNTAVQQWQICIIMLGLQRFWQEQLHQRRPF